MSTTTITKSTFRARCALLREYPLHCVDVLTDFRHQLSDLSAYRHLALNVEHYELALSINGTHEAMLLRAILQDPAAKPYQSSLGPKIRDRLNDTVAALFCQYRILDFELAHCGAPRPLSLPPRIPQKIDSTGFKRAHQDLFKRLSNWQQILVQFESVVRTDQEALQPVVMNLSNRFPVSFGHLQCLSDGFAVQNINTIAQNFRGAAFHLTLLLESPIRQNALPDIPLSESELDVSCMELSLPAQEIEEFEPHTQEKILGFIANHKPADIRHPLHMSLLLTMLVLIMPVNLLKSSFPRASIPPLSIAIGNQHPTILLSVEKEIWKALLRIAQNSSQEAVRNALIILVDSGPFRDALALPQMDPVFSYFQPDVYKETNIEKEPSIAGHTCTQADEHVFSQGAGMSPQDDQCAPPTSGVPSHGNDRAPAEEDDCVPTLADDLVHPSGDIGVPPQGNQHMPGPQVEDANLSPTDDRVSTPPLTNVFRHLDEESGSEPPPAARHGSFSEDAEFDMEMHHEQTSVGDGQDEMEVDPPEHQDHVLFHADAVAVADGEDGVCPQSTRDSSDASDASSNGEESDGETSSEQKFASGGMRRSRRVVNVQPPAIKKPVASLPRHPRSRKSTAIIESDNDHNKAPGPVSSSPTAWVKLEEDAFVDASEPIMIAGDRTSPHMDVLFSENQVTAYGPNAPMLSFSPIAYHAATIRTLDSLIQLVEDGYKDGRPLHIVKPGNNNNDSGDESTSPQEISVFKIVSEDEFDAFDDQQVQNFLRHHHIVVTGRRLKTNTFSSALQCLAPLQRFIEYQDQSLPYNDRLRTGKAIDLLNATQSNKSKILNGLNFPDPLAGVEPTSFSSDTHALSRVIGQEGWQKRAVPVEDIRWGLAATKGAFHPWHIDSDGFATFIDTIVGSKWWIVARPINGLSADTFNNTGLMVDDRFDLNLSGKGLFAAEAILLEPGSRLIMRPNTLHAVYSPTPAVCRGGHFYSTSTIRDTFVGLIHTFVCDKYITNTSHPPARFMLAQMINFYHSALVRKEIFSGDPSHAHVPDPSQPEGFMDLMIACGIGALLNVLSPQTYLVPDLNDNVLMDQNQSQRWSDNDENALREHDRKLFCLARGQVFEIVAWLNANFRICHSDIDSPQKLFSSMLVDMCKTIHHYKWQADANAVVANPNFTLDRLCVQMDALLSMPIVGCGDLDTKTWALPLHANIGRPMLPDMIKNCDLEKVANVEYMRLSLPDLFKSGETILDQRYAEGLDIKHEYVAEIVPVNTDSHPRKKRKRHA